MPTDTEIELDAQYRQLREECGLLDRSDRGKLAVTGPDAAEYLQGQLTNDTEALGPGDGLYAALLDRKGHMQADMRVLRPGAGPDLWLDTEAVALAAVLKHLTMYSIGRDVAVTDVSAERSILSLIGPRSVELAGTAALPENACEVTGVAGVECVAAGTAAGIDLIAPAEEAERLRAAIVAKPAPSSSPPRRRRSSGSRPACPATAPRWAARRCPPRPTSSSVPSASPRAATSARRRSPASTTRGGPTATCGGCD